MNKKVIIIASAVLAFFAGAIWVSEVPVVAALVAFLEVCAGFGCGFFFYKELIAEQTAKTLEEAKSLKTAQEAVKKEKAEVSTLVSAQKAIAEAKKPTTRKSGTKNSK